RDSLGRKMSKSLGNSPDPLDLIAKYGADGVRCGMMMAAPAGNDILFDEKLCENGRNFCNKIWNAFRLVNGWQVDNDAKADTASEQAMKWFAAKLAAAEAEVADLIGKFRISEALNVIYRLFWDEFSSWYLEMVKPAWGAAISGRAYRATQSYFDALLRLLHPFMPFITEELWQNLDDRRPGESIMYAPLPQPEAADDAILVEMEQTKEIVTAVRGVRAKRNIPQKEALELRVVSASLASPGQAAVVTRLANTSKIVENGQKDATGASFLVGTTEFCVPLADNIDLDAERAKIHKDIKYYEGFLASVQKKLSNERFVAKAPAAVIDAERRKLSDAETKLATLRQALAAISDR
ncbi:MAG: class I tRNA ligase family protein, partial [Muribaculaceae bacterium]|nr:class I tRNA ligase family protein [Muribaculaceae bacterium]